MEYDELVQETVQLGNILRNQTALDKYLKGFNLDTDILLERGSSSIASPGIIFYLNINSDTFCLRALASGNIKETLESLKVQDEDISNLLRINWDIFDQELLTFSTSSFAEAEILVDNLANRRLPIREEAVCNLSDLGVSWWMESSDRKIKIFFQNYRVGPTSNFIRLGPLGESIIAMKRFKRMIEIFKENNCLKMSSLTDQSLEMDFDLSRKELYEEMYRFFFEGVSLSHNSIFLKNGKDETLRLYLNELSLTRRLWLQITQRYHF